MHRTLVALYDRGTGLGLVSAAGIAPRGFLNPALALLNSAEQCDRFAHLLSCFSLGWSLVPPGLGLHKGDLSYQSR